MDQRNGKLTKRQVDEMEQHQELVQNVQSLSNRFNSQGNSVTGDEGAILPALAKPAPPDALEMNKIGGNVCSRCRCTFNQRKLNQNSRGGDEIGVLFTTIHFLRTLRMVLIS